MGLTALPKLPGLIELLRALITWQPEPQWFQRATTCISPEERRGKKIKRALISSLFSVFFLSSCCHEIKLIHGHFSTVAAETGEMGVVCETRPRKIS